ncbi:MAG: rhodanese-like domain-containing protein [Acidobacteriaceae bacterium]|nr:rhodanese-like domain-containing protein [Acidobacteriaceae bacterium]
MNEVSSRTISPLALSTTLGDGATHELLDVRTPGEYASAHVPGAKLLPLNELKVEDYLAAHKPGCPIYVVCQAGMRAAKAVEQFKAAGCNDCVLVEGGTEAWINAGLPVHRGTKSPMPLMRQVQIVVGSLAAIGSVLALYVNIWFVALPFLLGCGLLFSGVTGTCGMAFMLAKMPWNRQIDRCSQCCA